MTSRKSAFVTLSGQPKDAELGLYAADAVGGATLDEASSEFVDAPPAVAVESRVEAGSYYIKVSADYYFNDVSAYSLWVGVEPVPVSPRPPVHLRPIRVQGKATNHKDKLLVDVSPDQATANYHLVMQKLKKGNGQPLSRSSPAARSIE